MKLSIRTKAIGALIATGILGGIAPLFMKIALKELGASEIVFIRFFIASILIIPLLFHHLKKMTFRKLLMTVPAGLLFSGNIFFYIIGLQYTTSIVSQLLYLLSPVFVSIITYILFRERISLRRIVSMIICFSGSTLLIVRSIGGSHLINSIGTARGNILVLMAITSWSFYAVYTKRINKQIEPTFFLVTNFLTALLISIVFLFMNHLSLTRTLSQFFGSSFPTIMSLCALGVINSVVFFFLYQWSLKHVSAFVVASTTYLSPLSAAVFAIPFFGEQLSSVLLISAASIFIGSYLILTEKK